jgi:hypothetical protein
MIDLLEEGDVVAVVTDLSKIVFASRWSTRVTITTEHTSHSIRFEFENSARLALNLLNSALLRHYSHYKEIRL